MIKIERTSVMNMENAIRGARNPLNSWDRMDSFYDEKGNYILGENDLGLAKRLAHAGSDHRKFLRQIFVSVDITAPLYWWKEFDTYKVGTVANSCSTMHKIHAKEFTLDDFSHEHLIPVAVDILEDVVEALNDCRDAYVNYDTYKDRKDFMRGFEKKDIWWQMIQLLPSSYNQRRTVQLNYQVLKNMYFARKNHKLDEWRDFCKWVEELPYFKEICIEPMEEKT